MPYSHVGMIFRRNLVFPQTKERNRPDALHLVFACDELASFCLSDTVKHKLLLFYRGKQWPCLRMNDL